MIIATALIFFNACDDSPSGDKKIAMDNMCKKFPMQPDGIVRLSKIKVNPTYLEEYMKYAMEVCIIYTSPSPRDRTRSIMTSSA